MEQYPPLNKKVKASYVRKQLKQINSNMMSCPKTDELEKCLEKINLVAFDSDIRGSS